MESMVHKVEGTTLKKGTAVLIFCYDEKKITSWKLKVQRKTQLKVGGTCLLYFLKHLDLLSQVCCSILTIITQKFMKLALDWYWSHNPNTLKSYKNYLQNTQHMVFRNWPTLSIGTERLACLNSPPGVQLGTLAWHAADLGFEPQPRGCVVCAFSPPSLPPSGESFFFFFSHLPHQPQHQENATGFCSF